MGVSTMAATNTNLILPQNPELLNNDQSAAYIGVTPRTLEVWRCTKRHQIPYIKVGRLVKYRKSALDIFLDQQTVDAE
jgi:Helix-turn-helix domain